MSDWIDRLIPQVSVPPGVSGKWSVRIADVEDNVIARIRERHFKPGRYTQLFHGNRLIMSDTPAERYDHFGFVRAAKGDVLISGLGIGMCVGAVLKKPEVTSVTVLEIAQDVIDLVAPSYQDSRVRIIQADALLWTPPRAVRFGAVWHDIWPDICRDNLTEMHTLNRRYGRRADWKGCWSQDQMTR